MIIAKIESLLVAVVIIQIEGIMENHIDNHLDKKNKISGAMFLITIGIVYGDIGTSPMYVMKSILEGNGGIAHINQEFIIGSLSLIIWTITLLTTIKYVIIAMKADNHGEGGIFSLYAIIRNYGKWLIIPTILGGAALLADGVLTPAVTVTTAVEGLRSIERVNQLLGPSYHKVIIITLLIIAFLFMVQRVGTSKIGKAFGPIMLIWFLFLGISGLTKIASLPVVLTALNPVHAIKVLFSPYNKVGFMILGSVFLATTGAEALYSDMGHVGRSNVYFSWPFVKVCLVLNYLGQGAWIINNQSNSDLGMMEEVNPFFMMLPEGMRPFAILLGALAAVIASQALITGSFTLVSEAINLDLLPHLEIRYPSDTKGQLYISTVNRILWIGCSLVVLYFRSGSRIESAYGLAITLTMLMTTVLISVYLRRVRHKGLASIIVLVVFGVIEGVFFISSLGKLLVGGYVTVIITLILLSLMVTWYRGTQIENKYSTQLAMRDFIDNLERLHDDEEIPLLANNLVFLDGNRDNESIDRDILYSIFDKDPKRADAYWFINVSILDKPRDMYYTVETYGTNYIFRVKLYLGFKLSPRINVYLRQIVRDLQESGELPKQNKKYSIYGESTVGSFKFCIIHKTLSTKSELSMTDERLLYFKHAIRTVAGSRVSWYGLDTSTVISETVPLIPNFEGKNKKIIRASK